MYVVPVGIVIVLYEEPSEDMTSPSQLAVESARSSEVSEVGKAK